MLKFRSLTAQELAELETEFKQFLILNELYDAEWRALASRDPAKAQGFIDLFSNIVLEKAYSHMPGLLQIGDNFVSVFDLRQDPWQLYHFQLTKQAEIGQVTAQNFVKLLHDNWQNLTLHSGSKKSSEHKSSEVFTLISKGAMPLHQSALQEFLQYLNAK